MLNVGSLWHRWDPHLHTPDTLFANEYAGGWEQYLTAIETATPRVEALGITEYGTIEAYKRFLTYRKQGRAPGVSFVFPNVEFRFDLQTEKKRGVNVHLLFSPEGADHVREIERVLRLLKYEHRHRWYCCSVEELRDLGRAVDPTLLDDAKALAKGAEQFKLKREVLAAFLKDPWARNNCLIAVAGGLNDGTAGLQKDSAFATEREEIESLADIMFDANPKSREFWCGRGPMSVEQLEFKYGGRKPCLHGSDAHTDTKVLVPDQQRYCWIRADLSFMGLKQTLLEPELRVHVGAEPPAWAVPEECIESVRVTDAPWLANTTIRLNPGLVAVIGPKGSGKTALADLIASAAGARVGDGASFLAKAAEHLTEERVEIDWGDGTRQGPTRLVDAAANRLDDSRPSVRYLSQQFVDRLCASHGITDELISEIENVVFNSIPQEQRLGESDFRSLRAQAVEQVVRLRDERQQRILDLSQAIAVEDEKKASIQRLRNELTRLEGVAKKDEETLATLLPAEKKDLVAKQQERQRQCERRENDVEEANRCLTAARELDEDYRELTTRWKREFRDIKARYTRVGLVDAEWRVLEPGLPERPEDTVAIARRRLEARLKGLTDGVPARAGEDPQVEHKSLATLRAELAGLVKQIGAEQDKARRYKQLQDKITKTRRDLQEAKRRLEDAEKADGRRTEAMNERRTVYAEVFDLFAREREYLEALYAPLGERLSKGAPSGRRLEFYVQRHVDVGHWAERGEKLLDLRLDSAFRGKGRLLDIATRTLLPSWRTGDAAQVAQAMQAFLTTYGPSLVKARPPEVTTRAIGEWLFSVDHISLTYAIRYDRLDITKLSPGMRGIVLLILYLAVDQWDNRPLLVDQPEENLDPQSVYDELKEYFRDAKQRRQVILVTHNANLVVNTDADQVIVADSVRQGREGLPTISYTSGGLEDKQIRDAVCRVLEGGERAFRERERRYAFPRDPRTGV